MLLDLHSESQRIEAVFERSKLLPDDNLLRSHWAKYLSIVVAGFLENAIRTILTEFARNNANHYIANYVAAQLDSFQNPNVDKIYKLLNSFNRNWGDQLAAYWEDERKDAIASIMNIRHNAAHGRHMGTTIGQITTYYARSKEVVHFLHGMVLPKR